MINHDIAPGIHAWYSLPGPDRDVVIASQISLSRNITDLPFPHLLDEKGFLILRQRVEQAVLALDEEFSVLDGASLSDALREAYEERGILVAGDHPALTMLSRERQTMIRLGSGDHLRLSAFAGGWNLPAAHEGVINLDRLLEESLHYAVSIKLGYLSPEIKRAGTGLSASVLLHLPALEHSEGLNNPIATADEQIILSRYGAADSGAALYSAGCIGEFGETEEQSIGTLAGYVERLLHYEREGRAELLRRNGDDIADAAGRALGTLRHARRLAATEATELLSVLRLGIGLRLVEDIDLATVTDALFVSGNAQVRALASPESPGDVDTARAELVRRLVGRKEDV